jgi:hypothetical protein
MRKLLIGFILILLSLSTVFNYAIAVAVSPPTIQVSVEDLNGDGLKDIKFTAMKEGLGFPGVHINVSIGISSGLTLFAGETDNNGSCLFFDVPGSTYEWIASDGVPSSGEIVIPTSEFCLTESEAVAWQTIALSWIGESQDAGRALFEEMSRFVGFDSSGNPFSSLVGSTLLEYSQKTYEWLDKLQSYVVNLNRPELNLLNKMILPFKAVAAGFFGDGTSGVDFSQIANVTLQLVANSSEQFITFAFSCLYPNRNIAGYHDLLKVSATSDLDMTMAFPTEMILGAFQHQYKAGFLNPSVYWDSSIKSTDNSVPATWISILNMSGSAILQALDFLQKAQNVIGDVLKIGLHGIESLSNLLSKFVGALQIFYGIVVTLMIVFHWWETYQTLHSFLFNLFQGNPVLLAEIAIVAFNLFSVAYGIALLTGALAGLAATGVGIVLAIIGWLLWLLYGQVQWANVEIPKLRGNLGDTLTNLFRVRQGLEGMDINSMREMAGAYERGANVLAKFAEVAHQRSSDSNLVQFFINSSASLRSQAIQETELANAVGNATLSLNELLPDYLGWNGNNGQISAYLDGYNVTKVTYSHSGDLLTNNAIVGTKAGLTYQYEKNHVTADNLEGAVSYATRDDVSHWAGDPPKQNDSHSNNYAVYYNIGDSNPIVYDPKPDYLNISYVSVNQPIEYFYQYKLYFTIRTPGPDLVSEWTAHLGQASKQVQADLRRVEYALGSPVYEEEAISKPQSGNSWVRVNDSSSASGKVMIASVNASNGGCLFGPYIALTPSGEKMSGMPYLGAFRLKVSSNALPVVVASIDVAYNGGEILQSMQVKASDFRFSGSWQDFSLPFTAPASMINGLEFRVHNLNDGVTDLFLEKISITRRWNATSLYIEAAYNKPRSSNGPWSVVYDPSSLSGKVMMASSSSQSNGWLFGPYTNQSFDGNNLLGKACVATFKLKVASNQYASPVARIDIAYNGGSVLQWTQINANDFASSNTWQNFQLTFVAPNALRYGLEFRVQNLNKGTTDLFVDTIDVTPWGNSSVVFTEGAINKLRLQSDTSWQNVGDSSSFSGLVMKANASVQNGNWLFGPYAMSGLNGESMFGKPYVVTFRSKVSSNLSPNTVAYFDVAYNGGTILQSLTIIARDFSASDVWQNFQLTFVVPNSLIYGLEFRVQNWNNHVTDFLIDTITVVQGWSTSDVYFEAAHNKPQTGSWQLSPLYFNSSWSKVLDTSSASGLVMKASKSSPRSDCLFGPYITSDWNGQSMLGKPYTATFRLKVSSNTPENGVVYVDVAYNAGQTLQSMVIKGNDFVSSYAWQDFKLNFIVPRFLNNGLEFRIINLNSGVADVYVDKMTVDQRWTADTAYLESAYNKYQSGNSWLNITDSSASSGLVMKASITSPNGGCLFGPYTSVGWNQESMLGRAYVATFRLKVSSNLAANDVLSIDVACNAGTVLQSIRIKATDFVSSNAWQDFKLTFVVPSSLTYGLELRITNLNHGTTDVFADYIFIT